MSDVCELARTLWTWVLVFGWTFVPGVTAFDKAAEHSSQAESCRGAVLFPALIATVIPSERVLSMLTFIVAEMPTTAGLGLAYLTQLLELMIDKSCLQSCLQPGLGCSDHSNPGRSLSGRQYHDCQSPRGKEGVAWQHGVVATRSPLAGLPPCPWSLSSKHRLAEVVNWLATVLVASDAFSQSVLKKARPRPPTQRESKHLKILVPSSKKACNDSTTRLVGK